MFIKVDYKNLKHFKTNATKIINKHKDKKTEIIKLTPSYFKSQMGITNKDLIKWRNDKDGNKLFKELIEEYEIIIEYLTSNITQDLLLNGKDAYARLHILKAYDPNFSKDNEINEEKKTIIKIQSNGVNKLKESE